jgi:hypothetical protein
MGRLPSKRNRAANCSRQVQFRSLEGTFVLFNIALHSQRGSDMGPFSQDEAFELGQQWANLYPSGSKSNELLNEIFNTYYLINVVHNDYRDPDNLAIFRPFLGGANVKKADSVKPANGVNGNSAESGH